MKIKKEFCISAINLVRMYIAQELIDEESDNSVKRRNTKIKEIGFINIFKEVYEGKTVENVCKNYGICVASFYNHMSQKQKLLLKLKEIENTI